MDDLIAVIRGLHSANMRLGDVELDVDILAINPVKSRDVVYFMEYWDKIERYLQLIDINRARLKCKLSQLRSGP